MLPIPRLLCSLLAASVLTVGPLSLAAPAFIGPGANHPEREWKWFETEHFRIHYYQGYEEFARFAAGIGEQGFERIAADLGVEPENKIPLFITEDEFWNGFAEPLRTRIVLDPRFSLEPTIGLARFLLHEMTHILNFLAVENNKPYSRLLNSAGLPAWFAEGLAQYEAEYWAPEMDRLLRMHALNHSLLEPSARDAFILLGSRGADGYNEGYSLVKYMFDTYGHDKLAVLLDHYRSQNISFKQAVEMTFGQSLLQIEAQWRDHLAQRYRAQLQHRRADLPDSTTVIPYRKGKTWYQPQVSPDGKWVAYQSTGSYPTIRGFIYDILPLRVSAREAIEEYGQQQLQKDQKDREDPPEPVQALESNRDQDDQEPAPSPEPARIARAQTPSEDETPEPTPPYPSNPPKKRSEDVAIKKIESRIARRALDYAWRPDSQAMAYTGLKPKEVGTSTFRVQIQSFKVEEKDGESLLKNEGEPVELNPDTTTHSPSWLPGGEQLLVVSEEEQRDHLDLYAVPADGKPQKLRRLLSAPDLRQYRNPQVSPDGQSAVFEVFLPGQGQHLMLLDLATGKAEQLTDPAPREADRQPLWAPDGQSIYFISTRSEFAELYRLRLESRQLERLSQIYSGLDTPSLMPEQDALIYVRHHAFGTSLDKIALDKLQVFDAYGESAGEEIFTQLPEQKELNLTPLPQLSFEPEPYLPWMAPEVFVPIVGRDERGDQLGFLAQFSDLLQTHAFNLLFLYGIASNRIGYSAAYINRFFDTSFGVEVADSPVLSFTTDGSQFFIQRDQHISFFANRPLFNAGTGDTGATRIERFGLVDFTISRQSNLTRELDGLIESRQLREGWNNTLSMTFADNRSRNKSNGFRYSVNLSGASRFWGSQYEFIGANAEWAQYIPTWGGQVLAYHLTGTALAGETRPALLGGPPLSNILVLNFQNIIPLRGFSIAELQGPLMLAGSVEYRVPLVKPVLFQLGSHYMRDLELAAYVDVGDAWYADQRTPFPHVGTGLELRSNLILNLRNRFQLYFGAGKAMLGAQGNELSTRPVEFYGGFANVF